jgi:hypothetical protein
MGHWQGEIGHGSGRFGDMLVDIFIRFVTLIELGYGDDIEAVW